jgi:hypothetical protein
MEYHKIASTCCCYALDGSKTRSWQIDLSYVFRGRCRCRTITKEKKEKRHVEVAILLFGFVAGCDHQQTMLNITTNSQTMVFVSTTVVTYHVLRSIVLYPQTFVLIFRLGTRVFLVPIIVIVSSESSPKIIW